MIYLYALSSQADHINDVQSWFASKGVKLEVFFADINEDAKNTVSANNFTVMPVIFEVDNVTGAVTKLAEGGDIRSLPDDKVQEIASKLVPPTPQAQ